MKPLNDLYGITIMHGYMPKWAWRVMAALEAEGPMTNKQLAEYLGLPPQRTHEVVARFAQSSQVAKFRLGKEVYIKLPHHVCQ